MKSTRLEAFSDGVIAIIITIMVLEMKVPHDPAPAGLWRLLPVFLSYVLSFVIVAIYWVNHHHLVHLVETVDGCTLWANIHLLFWLSLMPFVTGYMGENHALPLPVALYGLVATACAISFYVLRRAIACRHAGDPALQTLHHAMSKKNRVAIGLYIASVPVAFIWVPASLVLVALPAVMYFRPDRRVEERPMTRSRPRAGEP